MFFSSRKSSLPTGSMYMIASDVTVMKIQVVKQQLQVWAKLTGLSFDLPVTIWTLAIRTGYPHDVGYRHDRRADNNAYRHDRRADKRRYPHDREIDIQMLKMSRNGYILG